jgi:hypothetical protein
MKRQLCTGLLSLLMGVSIACNHRHASTKTFEQHFAAHKEDYDKLIAMVQADTNLTRVFRNYTPPVAALQEDRLKAYRGIMIKLGIETIDAYRRDEYILFVISSKGLSISGSSKGLAYLTNRKRLKIISNIDQYEKHPVDDLIVFEPIDKSWYVYYEFER